MMTKQEYIKRFGHCPYCESDTNIEGGLVEIDGNEAFQDVKCAKCGGEWTDIYQLVDAILRGGVR